MKIQRVKPPPPPDEVVMTFSKDEGWAVAAALSEYAVNHPHAVDRAKWQGWATALNRMLR